MTTLAKLLTAKEPLFDHSLQQLEERTGKKGIDATLAAEIATRAAATMESLGLKPDCGGQELYHALVQRVAADDQRLARALGSEDPTDLRKMTPLIMHRIAALNIPRRGFFLKESKAAEMLRQSPPTAVMQRLGYQKVEDMLAHEDLFELFTALRFAEEADWLNHFNATYKQLKVGDFVEREIKIVEFSHDKWGDVAGRFIRKKLHNITHSKEVGAIALMPVRDVFMPGVTLKVMPLVLHYYNEIRLYSAFFKLVGSKHNFGEIVADTLIADTPEVSIVAGQKIHWRVVQRYFGKLKDEKHPEIFEPHVQPEDLHWRKAEELLYEIDPELEFWEGLDYVGMLKNDEIVSFNLMDVSLSYSNELKYPDRYLYHFRESLWNEIFARYLGQKTLEKQVLVKLDNNFIAPEKLVVK